MSTFRAPLWGDDGAYNLAKVGVEGSSPVTLAIAVHTKRRLREEQKIVWTKAEVTRRDLFFGFLEIGLLGFGGVAAIARHVIVEKRRWMDDEDYGALLAVGQVLPGGNTINASVMLGDRFQGVSGALAALAGLIAMPIAILIGFAILYDRFSGQRLVHAAMLGAGAAAAGLILGTGLKMMRRLQIRPLTYAIAGSVFLAIGVLRLPLIGSILVIAPLSIGLALLGGER